MKKSDRKKKGKRLQKKATDDKQPAVLAETIRVVSPLSKGEGGKPQTKFFDGLEAKDAPLVAPRVYRSSIGSRMTILLVLGRTWARHAMITDGEVDLAKTSVDKFRDDWVRAPYPVDLAASRFLNFEHLKPTQRARVALEAAAKGEDANAIKRAIDAAKEAEAPMTGLANGLRAAGKEAKPKRGASLPKGRGIGAWVCEQLLARVPDDKILKQVQAKFPGAKTNAAHLAWYRGKLKREGAMS